MKLIRSIIIICAVLAMPSCSDEPAKAELPRPALSGNESRAASQLSEFDIDFFQAANKEIKKDNIVVSPLSASMLLSMLGNVADKELADNICDALGCDDLDAVNTLAKKYMSWLPNADNKVNLSLANAAWYHDGYTINPAFSSVLSEYYGGEVFARDFNKDEDVRSEIRGWSLSKTMGLIGIEIDNINPSKPAIIANALYFKGEWAEPFKKENTKDKSFSGTKGSSKVPMMSIHNEFFYTATDECCAVRMPFGNGTFEAVLVLPHYGTDIDEFIASDALQELHQTPFKYYNVDLSMPRFKIEPSKMDLNEILKSLDIDCMNAGKCNIFENPLDAMWYVFQSATVEFNEDGAEAAAVTWGEMDVASPGFERAKMTIDRPFVFFINESTTGLCLFAGKVTNL